MNYGFVPSKIDGSELQFKEYKGIELPLKYSYKKFLPTVLNQGRDPICVPCSLSAYVNWSINLDSGDNQHDNNVDLYQIFDSRTNDDANGMSFKDGFKFLKHDGVKTDNGVFKIAKYAKIGSDIQLKQAIVINGPCMGGLPVYDDMSDEFWENTGRYDLQGGHAVSIVGYNEDGFIIRNSWGERFGEDGYVLLPYSDFSSFIELWTVID